MKPLLAHPHEPFRVSFPCYVQPKLNGIRALYQNGRFQSRDELPFPPSLLTHLSEPLSQIVSPETVLDGELYVHGWPLQRINAAVTPVRNEPTADTLLVQYHVFDVADYSKSFEKRFVERFCTDQIGCLVPDKVFVVDTALSFDVEGANSVYAFFVEQGYEGVMYRLGDCPYTTPKQPTDGRPRWATQNLKLHHISDRNNRVWHLLKRKDWQDDEFVVVEVLIGEGKYSNSCGAVVCLARNGKRFNVGSGFSDTERQRFFDQPDTILGKQLRVKYLVLSNAGIPLNPTSLGIRERII